MRDRTLLRYRLVAGLLLTAIVAWVGLELRSPRGRFGDGLVRASYDSLHALGAGDPAVLSNSPVVIVYLDLVSHLRERHDPTRPWPRELHAQLVDRLTAAGARAVVFDIVFSGPGPEATADVRLAEAIARNGRVVLAGERNTTSQRPGAAEWGWVKTVQPPYALFARSNVWGVAALAVDDDFMVRRQLTQLPGDDALPTLTWAVRSQLLKVGESSGLKNAAMTGRWLRYYAPPFNVPHVSFSDALSAAAVPDEFFRDRIVFIGARPMVELFHERRDEFRSPFHSWSDRDRFMPGVEVHATQLLNLLRGDELGRLSARTENMLLSLVALVAGLGLVWLRPITAVMAAVLGIGLGLAAALAGFGHGVWFPWLIVAAVQLPVALAGSVVFESVNWYRARRRLEAAKRVAEAKIREQAALLDKAHDAILVQAIDGRVLYLNPSAERLFGWRLADLIALEQPMPWFEADAELVTRARAAVMKEGEWNGELRQQARDGRWVTVASRWTLIRDDAGQPKALLLMNSDITEQKQLEQQFLRTQRMNTVGTLAGGMAHDLNNALAPILMGAQWLKRQAKDDETRQLLSVMETNTQRGADMVRQVLLFARGRGGEFERLELGGLVRDLEKMVRETFPKSIQVESFVARDLWAVSGNLTQLHQVLLNLCVNARDAMPGGGRLSFVADNVELTADEAAKVPDGRAGEFVSLAVADSGSGMPPEVLARIFEPFFTTKAEGQGTGIGLATVLRIVKAHAGFLRVESEPGQGTTFEVFLPRAVAEPAREALTAAEPPPRGQGECLLIADDEVAIRQLMQSELAAFGYRVLVAADGAEALALFREHLADVKLVITDESMPVMSGLRAVQEMRRLRPALPVILTSGETQADLPPQVTVLGKPFSLEELLREVRRQLPVK
jgi:PAS domain S-box-containing protein